MHIGYVEKEIARVLAKFSIKLHSAKVVAGNVGSVVLVKKL